MMTKEEFVQEYDKNFMKTCRLMQYWCRNRDLAMDLAQEAWTLTWKHSNNWKRNCQFYTWVSAISTNVWLTHVRKNRVVPEQLDELFDAVDPATAERDLFRDSRAAWLVRTIDRIENRESKIAVLLWLKGLSDREISEVMGTNINTAKSQRSRGIGKLRAMAKGGQL